LLVEGDEAVDDVVRPLRFSHGLNRVFDGRFHIVGNFVAVYLIRDAAGEIQRRPAVARPGVLIEFSVDHPLCSIVIGPPKFLGIEDGINLALIRRREDMPNFNKLRVWVVRPQFLFPPDSFQQPVERHTRPTPLIAEVFGEAVLLDFAVIIEFAQDLAHAPEHP
jgi:hypothetical protein